MQTQSPSSDSLSPSATALASGTKAPAVRETLRDGSVVRIRPIHPSDLELERRFIEALSTESRRFRFLAAMKSPSEALLKQLTFIDPATDVAYVALAGPGDEEREVGVARFSARADGNDCEFAVTVADAWRHKGLGSVLMQRLIDAARARGIHEMHSSDAADNDAMRGFADRLGFGHRRDPDDDALVRYSVNVGADTGIRADTVHRSPR
jgi:GNAT superfamily N-acetyltransferase